MDKTMVLWKTLWYSDKNHDTIEKLWYMYYGKNYTISNIGLLWKKLKYYGKN